MQECDACGLLFGGGEECPACGSRVSHTASEDIADGRGGRPSGPLPGASALDDAKEGIEGLDISISESHPAAQSSSLPFQVGGKGTTASSLPFGVGAPAGITMEREEVLSAEESEDAPEETPDEAPQDDDPWALPPLELSLIHI